MSAGHGTHKDNPKVNRDLNLLAPGFRKAVEAALAECNQKKLNAIVFEGYRSQELQALYYARGRTVVPPHHPVTNARTNLNSWHGYGLAVDIVEKTHFWSPPEGHEWFRRVADIFKKHGCKWGGDWTSPDPPHMQWGHCRPSPSDEVRRLLQEEGIGAVWRALEAVEDVPLSGKPAKDDADEVAPAPANPQPAAPEEANENFLAWGKHVTEEFRSKLLKICQDIDANPSDMMACMAFESGETFSPRVRNAAGSGAIGLIQFMPDTAVALGTSVNKLAAMSAVDQLDFVAKYFAPHKGKLNNLGDIYMAILWPSGVGKDDSYVLFDRADIKHPKRYRLNAGLDADKNGNVTRGEACAKIRKKLEKGFLQANRWPLPAAPIQGQQQGQN